MSLIINLEIWFAQSLRVSRIWIKEIPIRKNKLWKNLEAPDSYGKVIQYRTVRVLDAHVYPFVPAEFEWCRLFQSRPNLQT
jgi:hypothetical protein